MSEPRPSNVLMGLDVPIDTPPEPVSVAIDLRGRARHLHNLGYCVGCVLLRQTVAKHAWKDCPENHDLVEASIDLVVTLLDGEAYQLGRMVRCPSMEQMKKLEAVLVEIGALEPWAGKVRRV